MDKLVCLIISTVVMTGTQMGLFFLLSEFRYDRQRVKRAAIVVAAATCALTIGVSIPNNCDRTASITLVGMSLPNIIFYFIVSKYRDVRFFTTYCISYASIALVDLFAYLFGLVVYGGRYTPDWLLRSVSIGLWCLVIRWLVGNRYRKALRLLQKGWSLMLLCAVLIYLVMAVIAAYPTPIYQRPEDVPLSMLMVAMMQLTVVIIIRFIYNTLEVKEQQLREQSLQSRLSMAERQYALISENIDEVRRLRHDMKYHMNVIRGLLDRQDYGELRQYLDDYRSELSALDTELPLYSKNQTVNILAGHFARRAAAAGIRTEFQIQLPTELPVDRTHLTGLLGNLWQNALEACLRLPAGTDRFITATIALRRNKLMFQFRNSAAGVQRDKDGQYISAKGPAHGNGLAIIEDIVGLYDGFCEFDFDGAVFSCSIILPLPPRKEEKHVESSDL